MTNRIMRQATVASAVAAGAVLLLGSAAQAGTSIDSIGNQGLGNGNQAVVPVQAPIDICGNAVGALVGAAGAGCDGGSAAHLDSGALGDMTSAGNNGVLNGNQLQAPIQVPVSVCGNAVGALGGIAGAGCDGGASADISKNKKHHHHAESQVTESAQVPESGKSMLSADNNGILNGTQIAAPIQAPISVCGNAIAVAGVAGAGCDGGAKADLGHNPVPDMTSVGNNGILNGTQIFTPVQVPVDVSGNAIGVLGVAGAGSGGGADADMGPSW